MAYRRMLVGPGIVGEITIRSHTVVGPGGNRSVVLEREWLALPWSQAPEVFPDFSEVEDSGVIRFLR